MLIYFNKVSIVSELDRYGEDKVWLWYIILKLEIFKKSIHIPRSDSLNMMRTRVLSVPLIFKIKD